MIPKESEENCISFESLICAELKFIGEKWIPSFFKKEFSSLPTKS